MLRQIAEAVRINNSNVDNRINNKAEWNLVLFLTVRVDNGGTDQRRRILSMDVFVDKEARNVLVNYHILCGSKFYHCNSDEDLYGRIQKVLVNSLKVQ